MSKRHADKAMIRRIEKNLELRWARHADRLKREVLNGVAKAPLSDSQAKRVRAIVIDVLDERARRERH